MAQLYDISITQVDPTALVVSLQEAKDYLNVDYPLRDDDIEQSIKVATQALQGFTGLAFLPSKVTLYAEMVKGTCYFTIPYTNKAVGDNIKGGRCYISESRPVEYTCGETLDWMKTAVLKYVADLFIHRGEEGFETGKEAKIYCAPFISHGGFF